MVNPLMNREYFYTVVSESELNDILEGREAGHTVHWPWPISPKLVSGSTGVLFTRGDDPGEPVHPLVLVSKEEDQHRLYARFSQVRGILSPLSAWCHVLTPQRFEATDSITRFPDLNGFEAAWTGLIIAEATLQADRPLENLRIPSCYATQSFAIARTNALWGNTPVGDVLSRFSSVIRLLTKDANPSPNLRFERFRSAFGPIWASLASVSYGPGSGTNQLTPITHSLRALQIARQTKDANEARRFALPFFDSVPQSRTFADLTEMTPEERLRLFDSLLLRLSAVSENEVSLRHSIAMLAGYLATVAAGGAPSLSLTEASAHRFPEITAWAYTVGGVGESVVWTSSFDGLGRLVARELMRPLRLDDPPLCDFAADEGLTLADSMLSDPLVHLRIKQANTVTVAIMPGVNIAVPLRPAAPQAIKQDLRTTRNQEQNPIQNNRDLGALLADVIWPHLRPRLDNLMRTTRESSRHDNEENLKQSKQGKPKRTAQTDLPLRED